MLEVPKHKDTLYGTLALGRRKLHYFARTWFSSLTWGFPRKRLTKLVMVASFSVGGWKKVFPMSRIKEKLARISSLSPVTTQRDGIRMMGSVLPKRISRALRREINRGCFDGMSIIPYLKKNSKIQVGICYKWPYKYIIADMYVFNQDVSAQCRMSQA
jgi:hypothetical protein